MTRLIKSCTALGWLLAVAFATVTAVAGGSNASAQQPQESGDDLEVLQVRPNVYMIAGAGGNIAVQIGPLGAILVNAGSEQMSDKVLAAVKRLTSLPIRYIIHTSIAAD